MIYRFIFTFLLFMQQLLYGVDINDSIVAGDKIFYSKLEKNLDKNQTSDSLNLQQTLLVKLKEFSLVNNEKNISIAVPTTQEEYQGMFEHYLKESMQKSNYHNQLLENKQNLLLMKKQINNDTKMDLTKQLFYAYYSKNINFLTK